VGLVADTGQVLENILRLPLRCLARYGLLLDQVARCARDGDPVGPRACAGRASEREQMLAE
jgi:hypothetical protein